MSSKNLFDKFMIPIKYGCSVEETKKIIIESKIYLTLGKENLDGKFKIYEKYNLLEYIVRKPKNIIQSADLTSDRAEYLLRYYSSLKEEIYFNMVFTSKAVFEKRFNKKLFNVFISKIKSTFTFF